MTVAWQRVQKRLGLNDDGYAGPVTYGALIDIVGNPDRGVAASLAVNAEPFGMTTPARLAEFIAQIANETGGFTTWEENLRYSSAGMLATWPAHFTPSLAKWASGHPERVAEVAYGIMSRRGVGRMGNTTAGDGWRYRGRGALQLTGRANYKRFGDLLGIDLVGQPDLAAEPTTSVLIALEFFKLGNVNAAVDRGDFREARRITNGGSIGLEHVATLRQRLLGVLT